MTSFFFFLGVRRTGLLSNFIEPNYSLLLQRDHDSRNILKIGSGISRSLMDSPSDLSYGAKRKNVIVISYFIDR